MWSGYAQYFTGVPPWLVMFHIAGSIAVWVAVLRFQLGLTAHPLDVAVGAHRAARTAGAGRRNGRHRLSRVSSTPLDGGRSTSMTPLLPPRLMAPGPMATPTEVEEPSLDDAPELDSPWVVIVWNDPINLMSYVTFVLQKLFGYSREKAESLMLDVHEKGRAVVSSGSQEKAELDVFRLHEHGLWATMQQD